MKHAIRAVVLVICMLRDTMYIVVHVINTSRISYISPLLPFHICLSLQDFVWKGIYLAKFYHRQFYA